MTFKHPIPPIFRPHHQLNPSKVCVWGGEVFCNWANNQSRGMNTTICMEIGKLQIGPLTGIREKACFPRLRFFPRISRTSITMAFTSLSWRWRERCFKVVNVREGLACIVISPLFKRTKCRLVFYSEFNIFPALYYGDSAEKENKGKNEKQNKTKQEWPFFNSKTNCNPFLHDGCIRMFTYQYNFYKHS